MAASGSSGLVPGSGWRSGRGGGGIEGKWDERGIVRRHR